MPVTAETAVIVGNPNNIRDLKNASRRKNIDTSRLNNNNKTSSTAMLRATTGMPGKKERHNSRNIRTKRKPTAETLATLRVLQTGGIFRGLDC